MIRSLDPSGFTRVGSRVLIAVTLLFTTSGGAAAQPRTADPIARGLRLTDFPRVVSLAPDVYGYEEIRAPGFTTVSLIVVGRDGVLLADAQGSASATQRLLDEIRRITPLPVRWYVVGSDHGDHTAGNSVLPEGLTWIVHPTSQAQLASDAEAAAKAHTRARAEAEAKGDSAPAPRVVVVPPVAMTSDRQVVDVGGQEVEILFLGRAHTGGDLMVHLPRDRILFLGEAYLNRVFPAMRSAYPSEWVEVLDRALAMNITRFVPGHGFIEEPERSREELVAFRGALRHVIGEVRRLHALALPVTRAAERATWGEYAQWFLAAQQAPIAVRRVYDEIERRLPERSGPRD